MKTIELYKDGELILRHTRSEDINIAQLKTRLENADIKAKVKEDTIILEDVPVDFFIKKLTKQKTKEQITELENEAFDAKVAASLARLGFTKDKKEDV